VEDRATKIGHPLPLQAEGNPNCSVSMISCTFAPRVVRKEEEKEEGVEARAPATMPMVWPMACWRGLAPNM